MLKVLPALSAARIMARHSAGVSAIGFSHSTCLPALSAAMLCWACRLFGLATQTALAAELGLGEHLRLGVGEDRSGGSEKPSLLADVMEAVIGAVFLDGGLKAARRLIRPMVVTALADGEDEVEGAKSRLQEAVQARGWALPTYRLLDERGPDHRKVFRVECRIRDERAGEGEGRSKKRAEHRAAAQALGRLQEGGAPVP